MKFREQFYFLSNMFPATFHMVLAGVTRSFGCAEAAFQAAKDPSVAHLFEYRNCTDGREAKRMGRRVELRPDWETVKLGVMAKVVYAKFRQNPALLERLKAVQKPIVEDNTWHDTYWGRCDGVGQNWLGRILEQARDNFDAGPEAWLTNLGVETPEGGWNV